MVWNAGFTFQEPIRKSDLEEKCDHFLSLSLIWRVFPLHSHQLDDGRLYRSCALCRITCILNMHVDVTSSIFFLSLPCLVQSHKLTLGKRECKL